MGEVRVKLKVQGYTLAEGFVGAAQTVDAIADTGASVTVVSRRVAKAAGVVIDPDVPAHITGAVGRLKVPVGLAVLLPSGCGCEPEAVLVAVSDRITKNAGAEVILGHDYMQRAHMAVHPQPRRAACAPPTTRARAKKARRA